MATDNTTTKTSGPSRPQNRSIKSLIIDPFTQMKIGVYVIGFTTVFLISAGWLFYSAFVEQYTHVMQIFEITDPDTQWEAITNDVFYANLYKIGGLFTLYSFALIATIFRVTHRYHGPLISIERFAANIAAGHYHKRVQVRKKDELKSLAHQLNLMAQSLEDKHGSLVNDDTPTKQLDNSETTNVVNINNLPKSA